MTFSIELSSIEISLKRYYSDECISSVAYGHNIAVGILKDN